MHVDSAEWGVAAADVVITGVYGCIRVQVMSLTMSTNSDDAYKSTEPIVVCSVSANSCTRQ